MTLTEKIYSLVNFQWFFFSSCYWLASYFPSLNLSSPNGERRNLNLMGPSMYPLCPRHIQLAWSETPLEGSLFQTCSFLSVFPTPSLERAFAERVLWPNKLEKHCITMALACKLQCTLAPLKALTSPAVTLPVKIQCFPNVFDYRTF